jgi:hypothetical protein
MPIVGVTEREETAKRPDQNANGGDIRTLTNVLQSRKWTDCLAIEVVVEGDNDPDDNGSDQRSNAPEGKPPYKKRHPNQAGNAGNRDNRFSVGHSIGARQKVHRQGPHYVPNGLSRGVLSE